VLAQREEEAFALPDLGLFPLAVDRDLDPDYDPLLT
jgi:hypothetical protein